MSERNNQFTKMLFIAIMNLIMLSAILCVHSKHIAGAVDELLSDEAYAKNGQRVVGGYSVGPNEYIPYQVSMQIEFSNRTFRHICGGSILTSTKILTAAHCVAGQNAERMSVVAGIRDLNDTTGQRSRLVSFEVHENFERPPKVNNDIAILTIDPPLQLDGQRVDAIDVSGTEQVGGGEKVTLTGWGIMWDEDQGPLVHRLPNRLQKLNYKTITDEECNKKGWNLTETQICALEGYGKGACNGDSGGPLVTGSDKSVRQVGIVSYGSLVCSTNHPDVYTRVSVFADWIKDRIQP